MWYGFFFLLKILQYAQVTTICNDNLALSKETQAYKPYSSCTSTVKSHRMQSRWVISVCDVINSIV